MNLQGEINYPCGFASLPNNDHCWLDDKCRVCGTIRTLEGVEIKPFEFDNDPNTPTRQITYNRDNYV